ncbi:hypothetical protein EV193_102445 [Herbihabitans rhizosphaerae]|uniref:Uncharacterized protein n=1 Tax=Herbihabitans rhizosphaerae TaxID=1872711 RepID=A0A4Q7L2M0_9PSEU|nr:hypothetical protein EV193_102445 [Herbihabitans rhizosphaerae]
MHDVAPLDGQFDDVPQLACGQDVAPEWDQLAGPAGEDPHRVAVVDRHRAHRVPAHFPLWGNENTGEVTKIVSPDSIGPPAAEETGAAADSGSPHRTVTVSALR